MTQPTDKRKQGERGELLKLGEHSSVAPRPEATPCHETERITSEQEYQAPFENLSPSSSSSSAPPALCIDRETLSDWCDQYKAELEKIAAARAAHIEELLIALNHDAAIDWLKQWKQDDTQQDSVAYQYQQAVNLLLKTMTQ